MLREGFQEKITEHEAEVEKIQAKIRSLEANPKLDALMGHAASRRRFRRGASLLLTASFLTELAVFKRSI